MSDFESLVNLDIQLALFLVVTWGVASLLAGRHPARGSTRRPRWRPIAQLVAIGLGTLVLVARVLNELRMGELSWLFIADRILVALPAVGVPALVVLWHSVPRLITEIREPTRGNRLASFHPIAVVPIYGAAAGALVAFSGTMFVTLAPPLMKPASVIFTGQAILLAVAWWWHQGRHHAAVRGQGYLRRGWPVRVLRVAGGFVAFLLVVSGGLVLAQRTSVLPELMTMADGHPLSAHEHSEDEEADPGHAHPAPAAGIQPVSVTDLTGPADADDTPQYRFALVAKPATVRLTSGRELAAWTFNGQVPGPEIRVRQGDLVEITVLNELPDTDISVHWHGVDVPNAQDGVPGVTQNSIQPGERFVYRFRPPDAGTYWYHSHSQGSIQVKKGLFGSFIVDPVESTASAESTQDWFVAQHSWYDGPAVIPAFGTADRLERRSAKPGSSVRLRIVNTDSLTRTFTLTGTRFRVTAVDGQTVMGPTDLDRQGLVLGAGGRYDVEFTAAERPVRLIELRDPTGGLLISPDGTGDVAAQESLGTFEPASYGTAVPTPFGPSSQFDREYSMLLDNQLGFYDGTFTFLWTTNGKVFPDVPPLLVREGDLVKLTFANRSHYDHPMHLHGHHVLVLSKNGKPVTGSPLWLDTVTVRVGEVWEVAFRADNPGIWMDHCHIFEHAAVGMMTHLMYEGVSTPFSFGSASQNKPE